MMAAIIEMVGLISTVGSEVTEVFAFATPASSSALQFDPRPMSTKLILSLNTKVDIIQCFLKVKIKFG